MSKTITEGFRDGEFILSEANHTRSRGVVTVTVAANTTLPAGQVLGQITSGGKFVPNDDSASDGSETAAGILLNNVTNDDESNAVDFMATVILRDAEVDGKRLTYDPAANAAAIVTTNGALAGLGIIVR